MRLLPLFALLFALVGCAPAAVTSCDVVRIAETPIEIRNNLLVTRIGINGQWVTLLVDTGAQRSLLTEDAARRLNVGRDATMVRSSGGVGGSSRSADAVIDGMVIGGVRFPVTRISVSRLSNSMPVDGLLGADVLLAFDLDIDVPNGVLSLYRVRHCPVANPPWAEPAVQIGGITAVRDWMMVPLTIDGVTGMAVLDTGAQVTAIGPPMVRRLNLSERDFVNDPTMEVRGVGDGAARVRLHMFKSVQLGPIAAPNVRIPVLPVDIGSVDGLIGQDFLHNRRLWMSFPTRRLFISQRGDEVLLRR